MEALLNQDVFLDFGPDPLMPLEPSPIYRLVGSSTSICGMRCGRKFHVSLVCME